MLSVEIEDPEWSCIKMGSLVKSVMIFPLGWEEPWLILGSDRRILSIVSQSNTLTLTLTPLVPDLCAVNQKDILFLVTLLQILSGWCGSVLAALSLVLSHFY